MRFHAGNTAATRHQQRDRGSARSHVEQHGHNTKRNTPPKKTNTTNTEPSPTRITTQAKCSSRSPHSPVQTNPAHREGVVSRKHTSGASAPILQPPSHPQIHTHGHAHTRTMPHTQHPTPNTHTHTHTHTHGMGGEHVHSRNTARQTHTHETKRMNVQQEVAGPCARRTCLQRQSSAPRPDRRATT